MNDFIFATPISYNDLKLNTKKLTSFAYDLKTKDKGRVLSNNGGWQSNDVDLTNTTLKPLFKEISKNVEDYIHLIGFKKNLQMLLCNGWFNINDYKDSNNMHYHPDCEISGVYYLQSSKDSGEIVFYHPSDVLDLFWKDSKKEIFTPINSKSYIYEPMVNRLFLFPSWLKHSVMPNMDKKLNRISFSFNIVIK
jgi:uncharacterized protein (TIGR02466 family)